MPSSAQVTWSEDLPEGDEALVELDAEPCAVYSDAERTPCHLLRLRPVRGQDGEGAIQYLYLSTNGVTECFVPWADGERLLQIPNDELAPGNIMIRTDREDRSTLFEQIVEMADAQPTMRYLRNWRSFWLEAIRTLAQRHASGRGRGGAYMRIQADLERLGVRVAPQTVRTWVLGDVIGPASLESIKGVGELSNHPMLRQYPERVDDAFRQIRSIHRALGRKINRALEEIGAVARTRDGGTASKAVRLDPKIEVPLDDMLDLLEYWEVLDVSESIVAVPVPGVGRLLSHPAYGE